MVPLSPLPVAVVGLGGISQSVHLPLLARRWDLFRIAALVDLSAQRTDVLGARYGVDPGARFTTVADLLAARAAGLVRVDAVVLATTGSHVPEVGLLTAAGLPVLAEKPLAFGLAEIDTLERDAAAAGRDLAAQLMVGYMKEHDPATERARTELAGKRLRAVTVEVLHPADDAQLGFARLLPPPTDVDPTVLSGLTERTRLVVDDVMGEGAPAHLRTLYTNVLLGSIVHDVALLRHVVGGIDRVDTVTHWGDAMPGSVEMTGSLAGGARLHLGWHFIPDYPDYRETVSFHHETGSVQLRFSVPYLLNAPTELTVVGRAPCAGTDSEASGGPGGEVRATYRWNQSEAFENELVAFHGLATRGERALSSVAEGRADVEVAHRMLSVLAAGGGVVLSGEAGRPERGASRTRPSAADPMILGAREVATEDSRAFDVVTIGRVGVDIYPLQTGVGLEEVATFGKFLGGSPTNVAVAAARHGRRAAVITRTGEDAFGRYVHQALRELGVDDRFVTGVPGWPTPVTFCEIFPPDDFPLYFYRYPSAPDLQITAAELDLAAIKTARVFWLTVTGLCQQPSRAAHLAALSARGRTAHTVLDLDYRPMFWGSPAEARTAIDSVLNGVTVAVGNLEECETAVGESDPDRAADALLDRGLQLAIVKQGPRGVLARTSEESVVVPPHPVQVVNGLGAGDAFGGALCHGLISGWPLERTLRFANVAGAIVASRLECSSAMPGTGEVEHLVEGATDGS